jgi:hypothetical protein
MLGFERKFSAAAASLTVRSTKEGSMPVTPAADTWERGTRRLILHVAVLDRLTREPGRRLGDVLERELGRETFGLALAAAGVGLASAASAGGIA